MNQHLKFVIAFLLCFPLYSHANWKEIQAKGSLRLATEGAFAPFNYYEGKKLTGFEVELAQLLASELGLKVSWSTLPFESLLIGLAQNRFDLVIASHGITPKRAQTVDFTQPHYCTGGVILSHSDGPLKISELKGKKIGVQIGSSYFEQLKQLKEAPEVQTYPKDTDALAALMLKRIDAMVTDRFVARQAQQKHQSKNLKLGEMVFVEQVAMAAAKNSPEAVSALNKALDTIMSNGSYQKLSEKYFGEDIRCQKVIANPGA